MKKLQFTPSSKRNDPRLDLHGGPGHQLQQGDLLSPFIVTLTSGAECAIPDPSARFVHLQFRRFAGCPICHTHLRTFVTHRDALRQAGVREIVFFHSSAALIARYSDDFPLDLVADPDRRYYRAFGVETSAGALMHLKVLGAIFRSMFREKWRLPKVENGRLGLPADILIDGSGRVVAAKYGVHAYDQWSVSTVLSLARTAAPIDSACVPCHAAH